MTDFVALCRAARELPGQDTHDRLWAAWCALPEWHFIAAPSPVGPLPFSSFIEAQRCVMAFTSAQHADTYARSLRIGPLMTLPPPAAIQRMPQLKMYGVYGFLVDVGPDGFHTSLDNLWAMFHRFRAPPPPPPPRAPAGPPPGSIEWFLALPMWHLVVNKNDRAMPELATQGADLVGVVYSSPRPDTAPLPPKQVLAMLADLEVVRHVRFDDKVTADLIELRHRTL